MPQLDGLRAIAISLVLWAHWAPHDWHKFANTDIGFLGVNLFFVLSGFLISGILIDVSTHIQTPRERRIALGRFYIRRFLRIFPVYYLVLALVILLNVPPFRSTWPWHFAYLSNFNYWVTGSHINVHGGHLWSLSVEEQFYMAWPLILLSFKTKRLPLLIGLILCAPIFRWLIAKASFVKCPDAGIWLTPSVFDSLGIGSLVAYLERQYPLRVGTIARLLFAIGCVGTALICMSGQLGVFKQTFFAFVFGALVWKASHGFSGYFGWYLQLKPVTYIGTISYGIYLIHGFALPFWFWLVYAAPIPLYRVFARIHLSSDIYRLEWFTLMGMGVVTFAMAALSFRLFETPIMSMKRNFPYKKLTK